MSTDSRVKSGILSFTAPPGGTSVAFSGQITEVSINPSVDTAEATEVLSGDKVGGASTVSDTLDFTLIADFDAPSAASLQAFSWAHRGEVVEFDVQFTDDAGTAWTGTCEVKALQVGGAVNKQITVTGSYPIRAIVPPTGFGDGGLP
jgi:hypothetical protein